MRRNPRSDTATRVGVAAAALALVPVLPACEFAVVPHGTDSATSKVSDLMDMRDPLEHLGTGVCAGKDVCTR